MNGNWQELITLTAFRRIETQTIFKHEQNEIFNILSMTF